MPAPITVRPASLADLAAVTAIYAHHVLVGTGSFEIDPPDIAEMTARFEKVHAQGWPFLVAIDGAGEIAGFAYAAQFRDRAAYARTVENSVYIAPAVQRAGIGGALLSQLIKGIRQKGGRQIIAVIGDSQNHGSIALHAAAGFRHVGTYEGVGEKFGRILDVVLMQRQA